MPTNYVRPLSRENAIFLFVNVGGQDYDNIFNVDSQTGEISLQWFAQSRQHDETPVIQRIKNASLAGKLFLCVYNEKECVLFLPFLCLYISLNYTDDIVYIFH